ncbi:unnamed protein product [Brassica oleracea]
MLRFVEAKHIFGGDTFEMVLTEQVGNKIHVSCKTTHMYLHIGV